MQLMHHEELCIQGDIFKHEKAQRWSNIHHLERPDKMTQAMMDKQYEDHEREHGGTGGEHQSIRQTGKHEDHDHDHDEDHDHDHDHEDHDEGHEEHNDDKPEDVENMGHEEHEDHEDDLDHHGDHEHDHQYEDDED